MRPVAETAAARGDDGGAWDAGCPFCPGNEAETPRHDDDLIALDDDRIREVLQAYRARFADAVADPRVEHVVIFRNRGPMAHASLRHPHSQLVGLPFVPPAVAATLERSRRHREQRGTILLLDLVRAEVDDGRRLILESGRFAAFIPFAAAHDYETWIAPRAGPLPPFDRADDSTLADLGRACAGRWRPWCGRWGSRITT